MKRVFHVFAFLCLLGVPIGARAQNTLSITVSADSSTTIVATIAAGEVRVKQASGQPIAFVVSDSAGSPSSLTVEAGGTYSFFGTGSAGYASGATVGTLRLVRGAPVAFQVTQLPRASSLPSGATATTQTQADNSTKIATTAYVDTGLATKVPTSTTVNGHALSGNVTVAPADLASGALADGMTATTQSAGDNTTKLASDAFVLANSTQTIASGTATLGTGAISSGTCATVVTVAGTGIATTDDIIADFNADPTSTTGYQASANGMLTIIKYPTSGNVNFKVCNSTTGSITPGAATLNWRVTR